MLIFKSSQVIKYYVMFAFLFVQTVYIFVHCCNSYVGTSALICNLKLCCSMIFGFSIENLIKLNPIKEEGLNGVE